MRRTEVRELLIGASDPEYKVFNDRIANCKAAPSIGVRVPEIRKIARQIVKENWEEFLEDMERIQEDTSLPLMQEEHMLQGMVTGLAKMDDSERVRHLDQWIPGILSWGDCDTSVSDFKFMKKNQEFWYTYLTGYLAGGREFEVRCALVGLMDYFINDDYIDRVLSIFSNTRADAPFYVKMAQAWALSVCFVKYRDKTLAVFQERRMDSWVQNKAIQKCRESYRVSAEDKELLKTCKITKR